jgi:tetratricopeptide (TPR) repeat protein
MATKQLITSSILPDKDQILAQINFKPEKLREMPHWQRANYIAAINYLQEHEPQNPSNLEKVAGCIEAFHHFCEFEEWEIAHKILLLPLNTPMKETLHKQLEIWGYYQEQINLYNAIYDKINIDAGLSILNSLGDAYLNLGQNQAAESSYQKALKIAINLQDEFNKALALRGLGNINCLNKNYQLAVNYHQQVLDIAQSQSNQYLIAKANQNLGNIYQSLQEFEKAIQFYQSSLAIYQEINDYRGQATCLLNIGKNYSLIKNTQLAIINYQKSLELFTEISDKRGQITVNFELGFIYEYNRNIQKSQEYYHQNLILAKQIKELKLDIDTVTLNNLGNICYHLGYLTKAANYYNHYIRKVNNPLIKANIYNTLGAIHCYLNNYDTALDFLFKSLNILQNSTTTNYYLIQLRSNTFSNLGLIYNQLGDFITAINYSQKALDSYQELPQLLEKQGKSHTYGNLGISYRELGKYQQAFAYFHQSYILAIELDDLLNQGVQLREIGITYQKMGNFPAALNYLSSSYKILKKKVFVPELYLTVIAISQIYQENHQNAKSSKYTRQSQNLLAILEEDN